MPAWGKVLLVTLTVLTKVSDSGVSGTVRGRGCFLVPGPSVGAGQRTVPVGPLGQGSTALSNLPGPSWPKSGSSSDARVQQRAHHVLAPGWPLTGPRDPALLVLPAAVSAAALGQVDVQDLGMGPRFPMLFLGNATPIPKEQTSFSSKDLLSVSHLRAQDRTLVNDLQSGCFVTGRLRSE